MFVRNILPIFDPKTQMLFVKSFDIYAFLVVQIGSNIFIMINFGYLNLRARNRIPVLILNTVLLTLALIVYIDPKNFDQ
jgi:hypothetical protein